MKTCIGTYSFQKLLNTGNFTRFDAIDHTKRMGMDGIELVLNEGYEPEGQTLMEYTKALADHAREIGLEVPIYTTKANFYCEDPEAEAERICRHIDIAAACGIPMLRHDVTAKYLGNEPSKTPETIIRTVAPYIRKVAEYGQSKGVKTCSENHGRLMQDSLRLEALFAAVNHPNYGWLCDMGNFGGVDEDCAVAVSRLLPNVCFVHAKDNFHRSGMMYDPGRGYTRTRAGAYRRPTIFGHGDVPTFQILSALHLAGYDGWVSLEFEGMEDNMTALEISSENLKRMISNLDRKDFAVEWKPG